MWMKANLSIRKKSSWYLTAHTHTVWNFKINIKEQLAWLNRSYQPSSPEQNIVPQVDICVQHRLKCLPKLFWCGISFKGQLLLRWNKWIDFQSRSLTRMRAHTHTDTCVWHHHHSLDDATAARNKYTQEGAHSRRLANKNASALNRVHFLACRVRPGSGFGASVSLRPGLGWGSFLDAVVVVHMSSVLFLTDDKL